MHANHLRPNDAAADQPQPLVAYTGDSDAWGSGRGPAPFSIDTEPEGFIADLNR